MDAGPVDLGGGHSLSYYVLEEGGPIVGVVHFHPALALDGSSCRGSLLFDLPDADKTDPERKRPRWKVEQWEPLTLSPSIQCRGGCGIHGHIREGRWVE